MSKKTRIQTGIILIMGILAITLQAFNIFFIISKVFLKVDVQIIIDLIILVFLSFMLGICVGIKIWDIVSKKTT